MSKDDVRYRREVARQMKAAFAEFAEGSSLQDQQWLHALLVEWDKAGGSVHSHNLPQAAISCIMGPAVNVRGPLPEFPCTHNSDGRHRGISWQGNQYHRQESCGCGATRFVRCDPGPWVPGGDDARMSTAAQP